MPRRGKVAKRTAAPDAKYDSRMIAILINRLMQSGNKRKAEHIVYSALDIVEKQTKGNPAETFEQAVTNATPLVQVRPRRVAGATYQVPVEVKGDRGLFLAIKWMINSARGREGKPMADRLAAEILEASQGQGAAIKKREELHKMAHANRAFVHFRW
ncbi:MAG: 30S ribosomal protein S7 [Chloroflexota bacterium]|nr:30S ribosomal protein S7 [Chloroflexota bacterium]